MRTQILAQLRSVEIYTNHMRPGADNFSIRVDDLTTQNAHHVHALGGYLDITVRQYYMVKHKIRLQHPYMPCVINYGGWHRRREHQHQRRRRDRRQHRYRGGGDENDAGGQRHRSFYPMEVLSVRNVHDNACVH